MLTAREKFFIASKRQKARIDSERKRREKKEAKFHSGGWNLAQVPEGCLTLKQAADKYNRAPSGIHKAIAIGMLDSQKIGPYRVIRESDLLVYFDEAARLKREAAYRAMCARRERLAHLKKVNNLV